jgi:hypothetical protein
MDRGAPCAAATADMPLACDHEQVPERMPRLLIGFGGERAPAHPLRDAFRFGLALGAEPHVPRVVCPGLPSELMPGTWPSEPDTRPGDSSRRRGTLESSATAR